jgi:predicted nuclease of restriction endonuclease-like (RecB) superfamily
MDNLMQILDAFVVQAQKGELKTSSYPKEWNSLKTKVSFGMGAPARIPWIAFIAPEMQVSKGFYPVYLYYKDLDTLILAYGVSETEEFSRTWPVEIMNSTQTIKAYFDQDVPRYGDSYVFKAYKINRLDGKIEYVYPNDNKAATHKDIESDLATILNYYKKIVSNEMIKTDSALNQGQFYMESQLEDFIVHNWERTELGKKYDLIIEDGELISQQYKTDIDKIDLLVQDKRTKSYVVIELKKSQTSDDTIGQLTRYMGWILDKKGDKNVSGIIIAADYDSKLEYALKVLQNVQVFLYKVSFTLDEFKGKSNSTN